MKSMYTFSELYAPNAALVPHNSTHFTGARRSSKQTNRESTQKAFKRTMYESARARRDCVERRVRWATDGYARAATPRLHDAVAQGDVSWARALLQENPARCDVRDDRGRTALHCAAWTSQEAMLRLLKDVGADVGCEDETGKTPLHYAAEKGHESAVRALIKMGASVDHADELGQTSLHLAAMHGHASAAHALLQKGADASLAANTGKTPLEVAVECGHHVMLSIFLRHNVKIEKTSLLLHQAAVQGDRTMVRILVEAGVSVKNEDEFGRSALYSAAQAGHAAVVGMLYEKGASVDHVDKEGKTPLHVAAERGLDEVVDMLLRLGASVTKLTRDGKAALDFATERRRDSVMRILKRRSDPAARSKTSPCDKHNRETSSASDGTHAQEADVQTPTSQCTRPMNDGSDEVNEASEEVEREEISISRLQTVYENDSSTPDELRRALREALDQLAALAKRVGVDTSRSLSDDTSVPVCSPNGAASASVEINAQQRRVQNKNDSRVNRKRKFEADYDQARQSFKQWKPTIESRDNLMQRTKPELQEAYLAVFGKRASNQMKKANLVDVLTPKLLGSPEEDVNVENRQMPIPDVIDLTDDHA